jgi:chemotaxis protein MotB
MRKLVNFTLALVAISLLFPSCVSKKKFTELLSSKEAVDASLASSQEKVKMLEGENEELMTTKSELESKNSKLSSDLSTASSKLSAAESNLSEAQTKLSQAEVELAQAQQAIKGVFSPYAGTDLNITRRDDRIYVTLAEPVTFRSGSTRVARKYRDQIKMIAEVLKANPNLSIQVEGHSDNAKFIEGKGNNWNLSMNRAMSAMNILLREGVSPNQLSAVGRGEFAPVAADEPSTSEARAKNRRVEFVVVPDLSSLPDVNP